MYFEGNVFSSQHGKPPFELKHHFRFIYKNITSNRAINPNTAPRNVVASIGTENIKKIIALIFL